MNVGALQQQYRDVFGEEPASAHRQFLFRKIAWRVQADHGGRLPESVREIARAIARDAPLRMHVISNADRRRTPKPARRRLASPDHYEDGGFTGANMDRSALQKLLQDARDGLVDCVMVHKVDRLTRSLLDFARIMEVLDKHGVSFVSVTQQFNTTSSLGRLTLNILLSFAQFEREMIAERTRDKMSAARKVRLN